MNSIDCSAPSIDQILQVCINLIWVKYDSDNSGYLDREEAKRFVMESIKDNIELGGTGRKLSLKEQEKKEEEDEMNEK